MAQRRGEEEVFGRVKRERLNAAATEEEEDEEEEEEEHQHSSVRRIIRSELFKLKSLINGMVFFI